MYVTDSLRIQYIRDRDAGGIVQTEGSWTNNPVMILTEPCFAMSTFQSLSAAPPSLTYPDIHTTPGGNTSKTITLTNSGNSAASYSAYVTNYTGAFSGWASITSGSAGTVPAGCVNTATMTIKATGSASPQGLGKADLVVTYPAKTTLTVPIECWNFSSWFLPQYATIRTSTNKSVVQQVSRLGGEGTATWTYFADASTHAFDASLIMGDGVNNLSYQIFEGGSGDGPSTSNPYGYLYALSPTAIDSVTFPSYSIASGIGCNRDSTVAFSVDWYAPKHVDSADFMVAHFDLYPGPKAPAATISNLAVAYAIDWDIVNDSASNSRNSANFDEPRQMVYQQGCWTAPNTNRYGGISIQMDDNSTIDGGFAWTNTYSVYPVNGYENDTIWKGISNVVGYSAAPGTEDMNSVIVVSKATTIGPGKAGHLKFSVILATQYKVGGSLAGLQLAVDKARKFICKHVTPTSTYCAACTTCGDADGNGMINISDVVFLISFVFGGGGCGSPLAPGDCNYLYGKGDADGNKTINISDVVGLIGYVFNGTPCPHCYGMPCWTASQDVPPADKKPSFASEISIGCPVTIPTNQLIPGDSFQVRVYLKNDFAVYGFSMGLEYSSNYVEVTSVDTTGSILPNAGLGGVLQGLYPASNQCLLGWVAYGQGIPSRTTRGLLLKLNMRMLPGIGSETVDLHTVFIPPAGHLEVSDVCGVSSVPTYVDCGTSDIILGGTTQVVYDPSFNICPMGDAPFNVMLSDGKGPIVGDTSLSIVFSNCGLVKTCAPGGLPATLKPLGPSDANGKVTFYAKGFKCSLVCQASLMRNGNLVGVVPVHSFDIGDDSLVTLPEDFDSSFCNDYNGNGQIDFNDQGLIGQHLSHSCTVDPCRLFGYDFQLIPNTNLNPGDSVTLQLILWNNNQTQSCFIGTIAFYYSSFANSGTDTLIGDPIPYIHTLQSGERDTVSIPYRIPGYGPRCLKAKFTTNCCGSQIELSECLDIIRQCRADESHTYQFIIKLRSQADHMSQLISLLPGWQMTDIHIPSFPTIASDSIVFEIQTPDANNLGDTSSVTTFVYPSPTGPPVPLQGFKTQVVITFATGDVDGNCMVNISDVVYLITYIFSGGTEPRPHIAGDVNCDTLVNISDVVYLINYIFVGNPPPCVIGG